MPPLTSASGASFMGQSDASVAPHHPSSPSRGGSFPANSTPPPDESGSNQWGPNHTGHNAAQNESAPMGEEFGAPFGAVSEAPSEPPSEPMALAELRGQPAVGGTEPGQMQPPVAAAADPEAALEALQKNRACRDAMKVVLARIQERVDANAVLQRKVKLLIKASRDAVVRPKEVDVGVRTAHLDWPGRKKPERNRTSCSRVFVASDGSGPEENPDIDRTQPFRAVLASCARERRWTGAEKQKLATAMNTHVKEQWTKDLMAAVQKEGRLTDFNAGLAQLKERHVMDADLEAALPRVNWEEVLTYSQLVARTPEDCRACWTVQCAPGINRGDWTVEEDQRLRELVARHEGHDWESVAEELGNGRTAAACLVRFQRDLRTEGQQPSGDPPAEAQGTPPLEADGRPDSALLRSGPGRPSKPKSATQRKQTWTEEENLRLRYAVAAFGTSSWVYVAEIVGTRTDPQCRERWTNVLDPSVDTSPWTEEEDSRLRALVLRLGAGKWAQLAEDFNVGRERKRTDDKLRKHYEALVANKIIQPVPVTPSPIAASHLQLAVTDPRTAKLIRRREAAQAREAKRKSAIVPRASPPVEDSQPNGSGIVAARPVCLGPETTGPDVIGSVIPESTNPGLETTRLETIDANTPRTETTAPVNPGVQTPKIVAPGKEKTKSKPKKKVGKNARARKETAGIRKTGKIRLAAPLGLGPRPLQPLGSHNPVVDPGLSSVLHMLHLKRLQPTHVGVTGKPAAVVNGRLVHFMQRHARPVLPVARPTFPIQTPPPVSTTANNSDHIAVARAKGPPKTPAGVRPPRPQLTPEERRARKREHDKRYRERLREQRAAARQPTKDGGADGPTAVRTGQGKKKAKKKRKGEGELGMAGEPATEADIVQGAAGESARTEGGREGGESETPAAAPVKTKRQLTDEERTRKNELARKRWAEARAQRKAAKAAGEGSGVAVQVGREDRENGQEGDTGNGRDESTGEVRQQGKSKEAGKVQIVGGAMGKRGKGKEGATKQTQTAAQKELLRVRQREQRAAEREAKQRQKAEERAAKTAVKRASKIAKGDSERAGKGPQTGKKVSSPQRRVTKEARHVGGDGRTGSHSARGRESTVQKGAAKSGAKRGELGTERRGRGKKAGVRVAPNTRTAKTRAEKGGEGGAVAGSPGSRVSGRLRSAALGKTVVEGEIPGGEIVQENGIGRKRGRKRAGGAESGEGARGDGTRGKRRKTGAESEAEEGMPRPKENEDGEKVVEREGMRTRKRPRDEGGPSQKLAKEKTSGTEREGKRARVGEAAEPEVDGTERKRVDGKTEQGPPGRSTRGKGDRGGKQVTGEADAREAAVDVAGPVQDPVERAKTKRAKRACTGEKAKAAEALGKQQTELGGSPMVTRRASRGGVPVGEKGNRKEPEGETSERPPRRLSDEGRIDANAEVVDLLESLESGEEALAETQERSGRRVTSAEGDLLVKTKGKGKKRAAVETAEERLPRRGTRNSGVDRTVENGHVAGGEDAQKNEGGVKTRKNSRLEANHRAELVERRGGRAAASKRKEMGTGEQADGGVLAVDVAVDVAESALGGSPLRRSTRTSNRKA